MLPEIEVQVLKAYLVYGWSHRKIQEEILKQPAPLRGGGYLAMNILHKYGIKGNDKASLDEKTFNYRFNVKENTSLSFESIFPEEICNDNYYEGAVKAVVVNKYERNPKAKKECIKYHGTDCKICGFKFSDIYGKQFENKIHVHHIKPISEIGKEYEIDPINDLIPVCPNCHMIIHSKGKNEVYSVEEVKKMIENNKS